MMRRLTCDDLDALVEIETGNPFPAWSRDQLSRALADPELVVFGVVRGGELSGYAVVARLPFEAELQAMLVAERQRRHGLAAELMREVVAQASAWQSERLLLEVRADNAPAKALYRRFGCLEEGRRKGYYPPREAGAKREDAILMSLPLDDPHDE
ncbi:GNAT family N-acetyltransferase [Halomonas urumqiensis]|uniref:Ribosomal-protein-alanine N-acetyltransferase n=1 Tax=Halomonas urumqiensis TaxID=1684789 RepID=A0A2N7UIX9_9GAMM|nr:GNAT family N-acetyltransferase [Halomonas urumqiensis]PMR80360.1 ribosomal-protein-alanine N-acetyltransferase [Halomonas urumqiensis]PTB01535.1 GNAT family N-acetyltransferase [Halomonas urumqiensis]GHE22380.1 ribosomal-protein-alanine acetyltransferase [Halomonas urumqiensis]